MQTSKRLTEPSRGAAPVFIEDPFIAVAEQADLLGLAAFFLILYGVKALFGNDKRRMPPALGGTGAVPLDEDGNPRDYGDLDDIEGWMADEIHRRRIERGGVLRCDRCKRLLMHADRDIQVRVLCNAMTDEIFCEDCIGPLELGDPDGGGGDDDGERWYEATLADAVDEPGSSEASDGEPPPTEQDEEERPAASRGGGRRRHLRIVR